MKAFYQLYSYLRYLMCATNAHGVHSPFVFDLLNHVIYNKAEYYAYDELAGLRKKLLTDHRTLTCKDAGAKGGTQVRSVAAITRTTTKSEAFGQLLFRLVNYFQPATVLELGTSVGLSTAYLAKATSSKVISIEGCAEIHSVAAENIAELGLQNVKLHNDLFDNCLPAILAQIKRTDFVFFDGNHTCDATLRYFQICLAAAGEDSVFVFDDIYWSRGMASAWAQIKAHPRVTVTIDLFQMGIVFFRKGQAREDFVIRF